MASGGDQDGDERVLSPDELDIEAQEDVASLGDGRYVIGSDGPPAADDADETGRGQSTPQQSSPDTTQFEQAQPDVQSSDDTEPSDDLGGDSDTAFQKTAADSAGRQSATDPLTGREVKDWLSDELANHGSTYAYHIAAKSDGSITHQQLATDDVSAAFDGLLVWYARQLSEGAPVDEALGILLAESTVQVRYPTARHVFAVASGKGGVGKSTSTANLGVALANDGFDVAVVDVDLGMANLAGLLGVEPDTTLHDVLGADAEPADATYEAHGLTLIPGSTNLEQFAEADAESLHRVVEYLRDRNDVVLLDAGAGLSYDIAMAMSVADGVLLVTTAELNSLTDATKTGQLVGKMEKPVVGAVFTRTGDGGFDDVEGIATALGTTDAVTASVPHDDAVKLSVRKGRPVVDLKPDSPAARAYKRLAAKLTDSVGMEPSDAETDEFEWVDPDTGEGADPAPSEDTDPDTGEDGPVYEIPLEELIDEAGLNDDETAAKRRVKLYDRVKSRFS